MRTLPLGKENTEAPTLGKKDWEYDLSWLPGIMIRQAPTSQNFLRISHSCLLGPVFNLKSCGRQTRARLTVPLGCLLVQETLAASRPSAWKP